MTFAAVWKRGQRRIGHTRGEHRCRADASRRDDASNEMLRLAGRTGRVVVHVVQTRARGLEMDAAVAIVGPIERRHDDHDELCQGEKQHHRAQ